MRIPLALSVALCACGGIASSEAQGGRDASMDTAPTADSGGPGDAMDSKAESESETAPFDAFTPLADGPAGCTAANYLDRDSFDVVAQALATCLGGGASDCAIGKTTLELDHLAEGVGNVEFVWSTAPDGTHGLVGHGTPAVTPAPKGIVFVAHEIPANVTFEVALQAFYEPTAMPPFFCTWI